MLRQHSEENRSAHRVTDEDRSVPQGPERLPKRRLPRAVTRIVFARHSRIDNLVVLPKFPPEAFDKLAVPFVMGTLASSLNEEKLAFHLQILRSSLAPIGTLRLS